MYKIKRNVRIPAKCAAYRRTSIIGSVLNDMCPGADMVSIEKSRLGSFYVRAKALGYKITTRQLPDGKLGVWRVK